jgi:membrane protease YdiL (CAAX protease family)
LAADPRAFRIRWTADGVALGIVFGLVVGACIVVLAEVLAAGVLSDTPDRVRAKVAEFGAGSPARFMALAAFLAVIHSFLEEYYWRWFVFGRLVRYTRFVPAALLSGLAFSGHHVFVLNEYLPGRFWTATVPFSLGIAAGGLVWAWLYRRTDSLVGPWVSHFLVDFGIMLAGYRMLFPANPA